MQETFRKFTDEINTQIQEVLKSEEVKSLVETTKAAAESGTFEVIVSTADVDRQGEVVDQKGWDLSKYLINPIVLWAHDYSALPIGICDSIEVINGQLVAKGRFATEECNPFAQQIRRLYDMKIVRATSVGFIAREMEGNVITQAELLEFSFVPVPANPYAISTAKAHAMKLDLEMMALKGLKFELKAQGDTCTTEDGKDGVYDGEGVCVPKSAKAMGDDCTMENGDAGTMQDDGNGGMICKPKAIKADPVAGDTCTLPDGTEGNYEVDDNGTLVCQSIKSADQKEIEEYYAKAEHKEKDAQQIGAVLAQLQNVIDNAIVQASRIILDIVESEYGQSVAGKEAIAELLKDNSALQAIKSVAADVEKKLGIGAGEDDRNSDSLKQRSPTARVLSAFEGIDQEGLNSFFQARELMRAFTTAAQRSLEKMNKHIKDRERKLK